MAYKRYRQLVIMKYHGTMIVGCCFTQGRTGGFMHGVDRVIIKYNDDTIKDYDREALDLPSFTINWNNRTFEKRKYDELFFALFDMLFNRKGWDSKEHHRQVLDTIKNGTRTYRRLNGGSIYE